jgi:enoyl-[acyl-carrier-protein] reductase (NADH)
MASVDEIADAVLYLDKATFVTGELVHVDGGAHAGRR